MSDNAANALSADQQWALKTALKYLAKALSEGLLEDCAVPLSSMYPRLREAAKTVLAAGETDTPLLDSSIESMAEAALANYEFSCDWYKAREAAREAASELGFKPSGSDLTLAVSVARLKWYKMVRDSKAAIESQSAEDFGVSGLNG